MFWFNFDIVPMGKLSKAWAGLKKTQSRKENGSAWFQVGKGKNMTTKVLEANLSIASCLIRQFGVPGKAVPVDWLKKEALFLSWWCAIVLQLFGLLSYPRMLQCTAPAIGDQDVSLFGLAKYYSGHRAQRCMEGKELVLLHCPTCKGLPQASANSARCLA